MKLLILGNHTCGNRGDSAILRGLLDAINILNPHAEVDVMSRYPVSSSWLLNRPVMGDPLFLQIEACQICLIPSVYWVAAQVVFIYVACDGVAIVLYLTTGDLASIFSTELPHGFQVFQHIFPQHIHDLPQIFLEYRCIQFRFSALLPCMQKLFAIPTKIDSKMTDDPSRCIQLWCLLKEKIRWL